MGSSYFFDKIDGFKSKDIDLLCIMDDFGKIKSNVLNLKADGKDIFFFRDMDKEGFIKYFTGQYFWVTTDSIEWPYKESSGSSVEFVNAYRTLSESIASVIHK